MKESQGFKRTPRLAVVMVTVALAALAALSAIAPHAFAAGASAPRSESLQNDSASEPHQRLRLATTTSTENSGLLEALLPPFEQKHDVVVDVIAVGTGQALELGRNGDVDIVMVHAPELEREFVNEGYGVKRVPLMHNDFVILGPPADPADVESAASAAEAFERIAETEHPFISRGDESGTHVAEQRIWAKSAAGGAASASDAGGAAAGAPAGAPPEGRWYREAGQGMGAVITMANNEQAYTLADRGTYLAFRSDVDLEVLFEGDPVLENPYAVIAVDPERHPHVKHDRAQALIDFLVSDEGRTIIEEYRVEGEQLFVPEP